MTKIKIIKGTYGYRPNLNRAPQMVTAKDDAITVEDKEAKRLESLGVALILDCTPVATPCEEAVELVEASADLPEVEEGEAEEGIDLEDIIYGMEMTATELRNLCNQLGVEVKSSMNKTELVEQLDQFFADDNGLELSVDGPVL